MSSERVEIRRRVAHPHLDRNAGASMFKMLSSTLLLYLPKGSNGSKVTGHIVRSRAVTLWKHRLTDRKQEK
jgi:hypothetical protein